MQARRLASFQARSLPRVVPHHLSWLHFVVVQDFVRQKPESQHLRSFTLKEFVGLLFERCPGLEPFKPSLEEIYQNFNQYKRAVPVRWVGVSPARPTLALNTLVWTRCSGPGFLVVLHVRAWACLQLVLKLLPVEASST